jgi:cell division protein FtsN
MRLSLSILAAAVALAGCGETAEPTQNAAAASIEVGENLLWNELANVTVSNDLNGAADQDSRTESTADRPRAEPEPAPTEEPRARPKTRPTPPAVEPKQKAPAPESNSTPAATPKVECTPEHEAMGHCSR